MYQTRERILDSAERLFAERGLAATSLRAITTAAGANLAAVNYHFGGKERLIRAVFERRGEGLNRRRIDALERLIGETGGRPTLEGVLDAYIRPALVTATDPDEGRYIKLLGRAYTEPGEGLLDFLPRQYESVLERFKPQFQRLLPQLDKAELYWRLHFCLGALVYCMAGRDMMAMSSACRLCNPADIEGMIGRLIDFTAAGMRAPARGTANRRAAHTHGG